MNKNLNQLFTGVILGVIITTFISGGLPLTQNKRISYSEIESALNEVKRERLTLQNKIGLLRAKVSLTEEEKTSSKFTMDKQSDLERRLDLKGEQGGGLSVIISTNSNHNDYICPAADIRDLINLIRFSGSPVIALNDQRLALSSTIVCTEEGIIVDGLTHSTPYIINSLGDHEYLRNTIEDTNLLPELHQAIAQKFITLSFKNFPIKIFTPFKGVINSNYIGDVK